MRIALLALIVAGIAQAGGDEPSAARRRDRYGDDLPPGAVARLGTVRWRHDARISALAFAPRGQILVSAGSDNVIRFCWCWSL